MACERYTGRREMETANLSGREEARNENVKQSGRRKSKLNEQPQKKKVPQRGMGVAQLEKIRMADLRSKSRMNEIDPIYSYNLQNQQFSNPTFPDPSVQLHLAKLGSYGASQTGLNQALMIQRLGTSGFQVDPYGFRPSNSSSHVASTVIDTSFRDNCKSTPNMKCYSEQCGVCHKKKRINGGNLLCNGDRNLFQRNTCNFTGFNVHNIKKQHHDFVCNQEAEVVAVHRKENSVGGGDSVVMEYEFFPARKGSNCEWEDEELMKMQRGVSESSSSVGYGVNDGYNNGVITKAAEFTNGTCVDLSLKL